MKAVSPLIWKHRNNDNLKLKLMYNRRRFNGNINDNSKLRLMYNWRSFHFDTCSTGFFHLLHVVSDLCSIFNKSYPFTLFCKTLWRRNTNVQESSSSWQGHWSILGIWTFCPFSGSPRCSSPTLRVSLKYELEEKKTCFWRDRDVVV